MLVGLATMLAGRWKEAEELEVQVVETRKRVLREEHPDALTSVHNLAFTLKRQGHNDKAISLMEKCLQLQEQVFGPQHPYTISSLEALNRWQLENMKMGFTRTMFVCCKLIGILGIAWKILRC